MQIAQIHESETDVRWQHPEDVKACQDCQKALKSNKDKVSEIKLNFRKIIQLEYFLQSVKARYLYDHEYECL